MDWVPTIDAWPGPVYQRIVEALAADIASGRLARGEQLPTHRALSKALDVDLTTVTRAYNEARRRGLLDAQVGRGTFVAESTARAPAFVTDQVKTDFSMNVPPQPVEANLDMRISHGLAEIREQAGLTAFLNYQQPGGSEHDRIIAAQWLKRRVPQIDAEKLIVYPGTQPALFNILLTLTQPGDTVVCETLTYPGLRAAAARLGVKLAAVAMDEEGAIPEALERACAEHKPKAVYLIPTMHNPTAATMSAARRKAIASIIRAAGTALIEDDAYGALDPSLSPIANLIPERSYLAVGLSKSIAPALRVSFLLVPDKTAQVRLVSALQATALMPPPLMVALVMQWIKNGAADQIVSAIRSEAAGRQRLARKILDGQSFAAHPSGHHLWLSLPPEWDGSEFAAQVLKSGVAIVAADVFDVTGKPPHAARISLGAPRTRAELVRGLNVLAATLRNPPGAVQIV